MKTFGTTLSNNDKLTLISNFYTLLSAGIPILETVNSLMEDAKGGQKKLLEQMRLDLGQGQHLYITFAKFPKIFDKVTVNILKASEESGQLDVALEDLKRSIRKEIEFDDKIKSALMYPAFIFVVFILVMIVILVVVVPKIATVFGNLNVDMPPPTIIMIAMSDILLKYPIPLILSAGLIVAGFVYMYSQNKLLIVRLFTALPLISQLAQQIDLTRFTRSLHLMLTAGIPITVALELTEETVIKQNVRGAIRHTKNVVFSGKKVSQGLRDSKGIIPPVMIKMIEAGERSGSLDKAMLDVSEYLDYQVSSRLKTLTAMIEPIMLVGVGVMVGGMMMAIIAPIYQLIGSVGVR